MSWSLRTTLAAAAAALSLTGAAPAFGAETVAPPSHLRAYNLDWLNYIDPQDLPPTRYAVCIVDSGLAVTPDTPPDDPAGPILRRLATDGGSGEPQGTAEEQLHGTRMAMAAVAPINDWGTIGTWTGGRVISVRAMVEGETTFRAEAYERGISLCLKEAAYAPVAAINLSLSCAACAFSPDEEASLLDRIAKARDRGVTVVVSGGNRAGSHGAMPAAAPGVFAVAAGDAQGSLCDYASYGSEIVVIGPACPVDTADPLTGTPTLAFGGGSSTAAVVTSTLIAALRTLKPEASSSEVEDWVAGATRNSSGQLRLDGVAAARAAGLETAATSTPPDLAGSSDQEEGDIGPGGTDVRGRRGRFSRPRLPRPQIANIRWLSHRLILGVDNRPAHAVLEMEARFTRGEFVVARRIIRRRRANRLAVRLARKPDGVALRYRSPGGVARPSARVTLPVTLRITR